jgi:hypothetical protein
MTQLNEREMQLAALLSKECDNIDIIIIDQIVMRGI